MVISDFGKNKTIEYEGHVYLITAWMHVKPGKGSAFIRTKVKDVINGGVVEKTFRPDEKCEAAFVEKKELQYSYNDGVFYNFMDMETFEMTQIDEATVGDAMKYVKDNEMCNIQSYKGKVFAVIPPKHVVLQVTACEPGVKGDTTTNATKPCTLETGAQINVPLFVNEGDFIKVDTEEEKYLSRVQQ